MSERGDNSAPKWRACCLQSFWPAGLPVKFIVSVMPEAGPLPSTLAPGEAADCKTYDTLIELPEQKPDALIADEGYDTEAIRDDLKKRGIRPVIPTKSNRKVTIRDNKKLYRQRNCIERVIGHLKINRAVANPLRPTRR